MNPEDVTLEDAISMVKLKGYIIGSKSKNKAKPKPKPKPKPKSKSKAKNKPKTKTTTNSKKTEKNKLLKAKNEKTEIGSISDNKDKTAKLEIDTKRDAKPVKSKKRLDS